MVSFSHAEKWEKEDSEGTDEPTEWVLEELEEPEPTNVELPKLAWYGGVAVGPHLMREIDYYESAASSESKMGFNVELGYKFESGFTTDLRVRYDTYDEMLLAYSVGYQVYSDDKFIVLSGLSFNYTPYYFFDGYAVGTEVELLYRRAEISKNHLSVSFGTFLGDPYWIIPGLENEYYYNYNGQTVSSFEKLKYRLYTPELTIGYKFY